MIKSIDELIKSGDYPPIFLMFGEENFLLEEAYEKIIAELCNSESSKFNFDLVDCDTAGINKDELLSTIIDMCNSFPFMTDRRVVVVKRFDKLFEGKRSKKKDLSSPLGRYLDSPQPTTVLILLANVDSLNGISKDISNPKKKKAAEKKIESVKFPFNFIMQHYEWLEFPKVWESELSSWILNRIKQNGKQISQESAELIIAQSSPSLRDLNNEIEKLLLYVKDKSEISIDDVNFIVGASRKFNVFELQKDIGKRN